MWPQLSLREVLASCIRCKGTNSSLILHLYERLPATTIAPSQCPVVHAPGCRYCCTLPVEAHWLRQISDLFWCAMGSMAYPGAGGVFQGGVQLQIQESFAVSSLMSKGEQQDPGMKVSLWQPWPHHLLHLIGGKMALLRATAPLLSSGSREKQTDGHQQIIINDFLHDGRWFTQCILSPYRKDISELFLVCCAKLRIGENE